MGPIDTYNKVLDELVFLPGTPGEAYLAARGIDVRIASDALVQYHPAFGALESPAVLLPLQGEVPGVYVGRWVFYIDDEIDACWYPRCAVSDREDVQRYESGIFLTANALGTGRVVIVTRPLDALSLALCGVPALATCGYAAQQLSWLPARCQGAKIIYIAYDAGQEGDRAAWALCKLLQPTGARIHRLTSTQWGGDWNAALVKHGPIKIREGLRRVMVPKRCQTAPE